MICNISASILLALLLAQASWAKHISVVRNVASRVDKVKMIGESINLNIDEPYVHWYKKPDIDLGERFFDDDYHKIDKVLNQAFKSLTIKKANYTDAGLESYRALNLDDRNETVFNLFLYDLDHHKTSLVYEAAVVDLTSEKPQESSRKIQLEIELASFEEQAKLDFKYRKEAMPLDSLLVNGKKVESTICNHAEDGLLVKCLEVNLGKHVPFEKCKNQASFTFGYGYENADKFTGIAIKNVSYEAEIQVLYPPKFDIRGQIVIYEDPSELLKLDCETTCANPAGNLTYEWTMGDRVFNESSATFDLTFASLGLSESSAEIVCTVSNDIDAGEHLNESQRTFKIQSSKGPGSTTKAPSPTTLPVTTASSVTVGPSNATSEFGFFGNIYNKVKFFVQFVV